jgi:hypothetical protein
VGAIWALRAFVEVPLNAPIAPVPVPDWTTLALSSSVVGALVSGVVGALVVAFMNSRFQRDLEHLKADLAKLTDLTTSSEQKRAEVAAEVLVAALRMLDALDRAAGLGSFETERVGDDDPDARRKWMRLQVEARDASVRIFDEEFRRAWHLAEVFLPEAAPELLYEITRLKGEILAGQQMHAMALDQSPQHAVQFHKQGYGLEPSQKIGDLRKRAKDFLRPIAQLAGKSKSS